MPPAASETLKNATLLASSLGLYQLKINEIAVGQKTAENKPSNTRNAYTALALGAWEMLPIIVSWI